MNELRAELIAAADLELLKNLNSFISLLTKFQDQRIIKMYLVFETGKQIEISKIFNKETTVEILEILKSYNKSFLSELLPKIQNLTKEIENRLT